MTAIEAATKATQTADLLIQDLQDLNRASGMLVHLLVLPEIVKAVQIKDRVANILAALKETP